MRLTVPLVIATGVSVVIGFGLVLANSRPATGDSPSVLEGTAMKSDQAQAAEANPTAISTESETTGSSAQTDYHKSNDPLVSNDYGPAPEFNNDTWLNSDKPLKIADQKGKVVLIEFWTFECINCIHTLPAMNGFYDKYHDKGLVIMTDHFPEFAAERDVNNVRQALVDDKIKYPVAIDNDGITWNAYEQRYWPTMILVDKRGIMRYRAVGEHDYSRTDAAIQALLSE